MNWDHEPVSLVAVSNHRRMIPLLPGGEGRDEGELSVAEGRGSDQPNHGESYQIKKARKR